MLSFLQDPEGEPEAADSGEPMSVGEAADKTQEYVEYAIELAKDWAPNIVAALLVYIIGKWVAKFITGLVRKLMRARKIDETLTGFLCNLVYFALLTMVIVSALGRLGVNTTSFVAIMGAATLALGFALQNTLGDIASGVMLILFRPFKVGDFVETGGGTGVVEEIGIFVTTMRTGDNKTIIIPNSGITGGSITNYSKKDTRRVDLVFGIGYDDDIKLAKDTLEELCKADSRILDDPGTTIAVSELADSSVNFVCRPWVKSEDYWGVFFDLTEKVKLEFDAKGLSIPYPQRDLHLYQEKSA
ncbi:MAG: mechanosensitive ion channel domain-containing protein [Planctomycetota bacterium]